MLVSAKNLAHSETGYQGLELRVEDDGPGLAPELADQVRQRGHRADSEVPGHGIGLSIVQDIVNLYGGSLDIAASQWGGVSVKVRLPSRPRIKNTQP